MLKFPNMSKIQELSWLEEVGGGQGPGEGGESPHPILPNLVDFRQCTRHPLYIKVCSAHHRVNLYPPPSVDFPFLPHSMQKTELRRIFTVSCPQQIICNSIENHWKVVSFNMFYQSYIWHPMFYSLTMFHNQAQKCEFSVIFIF